MPHQQLAVTGGHDVHTVHFPAGRPPADVDVLVVGAGPVGLSGAVDLTARGTGVAVIEAARTAALVRAGAMGHSPRTVEHFRRWGRLERIHRAPDGYLDPWGYTLHARGLPLTVVHLTDPRLHELYGVDNVLVRPDQQVAWRGAHLPAGGAGAVLDVVLGVAPRPDDTMLDERAVLAAPAA